MVVDEVARGYPLSVRGFPHRREGGTDSRLKNGLVNVFGALDGLDAALGTAQARERLVHVPLGREVGESQDLRQA